MWNIFYNQSKSFCHPKASTMLEDLAVKGLMAGFSDAEIVVAIGDFYRQCEQVARENLERAKQMI